MSISSSPITHHARQKLQDPKQREFMNATCYLCDLSVIQLHQMPLPADHSPTMTPCLTHFNRLLTACNLYNHLLVNLYIPRRDEALRIIKNLLEHRQSLKNVLTSVFYNSDMSGLLDLEIKAIHTLLQDAALPGMFSVVPSTKRGDFAETIVIRTAHTINSVKSMTSMSLPNRTAVQPVPQKSHAAPSMSHSDVTQAVLSVMPRIKSEE